MATPWDSALRAGSKIRQVTAVTIKFLKKYHPLFQTLCPTYAFLDRADGMFNRSMSFAKDYAALISAAWDIDTAYHEAWIPDDDDDVENSIHSREKLDRLLGYNTLHSKEAEEKRAKMFKLLYNPNVESWWKSRYQDPFNLDTDE